MSPCEDANNNTTVPKVGGDYVDVELLPTFEETKESMTEFCRKFNINVVLVKPQKCHPLFKTRVGLRSSSNIFLNRRMDFRAKGKGRSTRRIAIGCA